MFGKRFIGLVVLFLAAVLLVMLAAPAQADPQAPTQTTIVVDSGTDPDDSKSKTCLTATPCTLRRAIVQAIDEDTVRPVTISFNIPADPAEGYNSTLDVWELEVYATTDTTVFRRLEEGQITIDGTTQPGGRSDGPKIILIGPGTGNKRGLNIGNSPQSGDDENVIRGLGFQNFTIAISVNSNDNLIEDNWFGLTSDGTDVYLRSVGPQGGSGQGGIGLSGGVQDNTITSNVFLGFYQPAIAVRGDDNIVTANYIGTDADGNVPGKQTAPDLICTKVDWLGGGGIDLEGERHVIEDNIIAGLRQEISGTSTQPDAITVSGGGHTIKNNDIGLDKSGAEIGVCGRGIYLGSAPVANIVEGNNIVNPGMSAISINGPSADANTLRANVIKNRFQWLADDEFNPEPEDAIQFGPTVPAALRNFKPARVTQINGQTVRGTSGVGSPCPACVVELFLEDADTIKEALQSLAVVTADESGNWTATIPKKLAADERLRTTSTTARFNTILGLSAGTTTGLSGLYREEVPCTAGTGQPHGICVPLLMTVSN